MPEAIEREVDAVREMMAKAEAAVAAVGYVMGCLRVTFDKGTAGRRFVAWPEPWR